jgi:FKBP-type peptidyl-prolyl cis-trans isomerase
LKSLKATNILKVIAAVLALTVISACSSNTAKPAPNCKDGNGQTQTTASGLKYEDLTVCDGTLAKVGNTVSVHYLGTLENGQKFDSSFDRNKPFDVTLGAGGVIPGWEEGLQGMSIGSKRRLIIPPNLGYGSQANGPIPANSTLIFVVQIMDMK